jgi:hypothetical protein
MYVNKQIPLHQRFATTTNSSRGPMPLTDKDIPVQQRGNVDGCAYNPRIHRKHPLQEVFMRTRSRSVVALGKPSNLRIGYRNILHLVPIYLNGYGNGFGLYSASFGRSMCQSTQACTVLIEADSGANFGRHAQHENIARAWNHYMVN